MADDIGLEHETLALAAFGQAWGRHKAGVARCLELVP